MQRTPAHHRHTERTGNSAKTTRTEAPTDLGAEVHGVLNGDATYIEDGADGMALHLDGYMDYVEAGNIGDHVLAINGDLTLSTWVRATSTVSDSWGSTLLTYGTNDYYTEDEETNSNN